MNQAKQVQKLLTLTAQTLDLRCFRGRVECVCVSGACRWGESWSGCILHDFVRQAIADNFAQRGVKIYWKLFRLLETL